MSDYKRITNILGINADKNFVQRILNRRKYPTLDLGDGNYATHKMGYSEVDGKYIVYPNVIYDPKKYSLIELDPSVAVKYALDNEEYIKFDSEADADWFSKNYKKYWGPDY